LTYRPEVGLLICLDDVVITERKEQVELVDRIPKDEGVDKNRQNATNSCLVSVPFSVEVQIHNGPEHILSLRELTDIFHI
jgi:hypothetical protein